MTYRIPSEVERAWTAVEAAHNEKLHWIVYATRIEASVKNLNLYASLAGVDPQTWMAERIRVAREEAQAQFPINLAPFVDGQVAA